MRHRDHIRYLESLTAWQQNYEAAKTRRDVFVAEVQERFPTLLADLATLLASMGAIDDEIRQVNMMRPVVSGESADDRPPLLPVAATVAAMPAAA